MNQTTTPPRLDKPPRSLVQRLRRWVLWPAGVLLGVLVGGWFVFWLLCSSHLGQARAEADRLDPGWRWDDLQARRAVIPDRENSALVVNKVEALLPAGWDAALYKIPQNDENPPVLRLATHDPNECLDDETGAALRQALRNADKALAEARKLADLPRGRYCCPPDANGLPIMLLMIRRGMTVGQLLRYDALLRAQEGNGDGAVTSNQAMLNSARSVGDGLGSVAQLMRMAGELAAIENLERILAQTEASEEDLARLQAAYEADLADPLLLHALRGERAYLDKIDYDLARAGGPGLGGAQALAGWNRSGRGTLLEFMNRSVEAAKLPVSEQSREMNAVDRELRFLAGRMHTRLMNLHAVLLMPATMKVADADARRRALQHCAIVALAAERFRLKHGRWPEKLDDLQPFLGDPPADPFVDRPLRWKRVADGIVIYSVGYDRADDGGNLERIKIYGKGVDFGFRLWDVNKRRQPAKKDTAQPESMP